MGVIPTRMMPMGVWRKPAPPLPYDAEVGWLESTGTQYVDTGVLSASSYIRVVLRVRFGNNTTGEHVAFGNFNGSRGTFFGAAQGSWYSWHRSGTGWKPADVTLATWHDAEYMDSLSNGRQITSDGIVYTKSGNANNLSTGTAYRLFGRQGAGASLAMAYARIYVDGALVRDFIPVRVGRVGYLYDRANPTGGPLGNGLYGNNGTGAFVVGPDK